MGRLRAGELHPQSTASNPSFLFTLVSITIVESFETVGPVIKQSESHFAI